MPSIGRNPVSAPLVETATGAGRRRLLPGDRERQIVEGAVTFFSEHGLEGQLRDLARRLGITHTLLYHYFPTKQALIERVYAEIFAGRWKPEWETLLDDKKLDVETKLTLFYVDYASVILDSSWVRIFVFSGLSDRYITDRYFSVLKEKIFPRLVRETRRYRGVPNRGKPSARELELLMGLHGSIFYMGIRRWIYGQLPQDTESSAPDESYVRDRVLAYLLSVGAVLGRKQKTSPISQEPI
jgi:AcrR family transcriptional regulator